ncbi:hypothetical protein SNEBB_003746 [Seison nebaliae]|nr:hypothetical protein SNEBB_003746 [Seison nebaliae]
MTVKKIKTGILLMNMGGPSHFAGVNQYLRRLFNDRDIMQLPFQSISSKFLADRRTLKIEEQYKAIGGGSPSFQLTESQGNKMANLLDEISKETAPHKSYVSFRYAHPLTNEAIDRCVDDNCENVVVFSQYPHYSCTTTGSSLNDLVRIISEKKLKKKFNWSLIDRWWNNENYINCIRNRIEESLEKFPENERGKVLLLFSAHSIPFNIMKRGDTYPMEIGGTCTEIMRTINNPYRLVWQSKVGPLPWLAPSTPVAMKEFAEKGHVNQLLIPISFTTDHIETLYEIDKEYLEPKFLQNIGIRLAYRTESLNDSNSFIRTMTHIVEQHLINRNLASSQFQVRCNGCSNPNCFETRKFFKNL